MLAKLLRCTPDPELLCAAAALTSTRPEGASELFETIDSKKAAKVIKNVTGYGHVSIIEHATFTFSVEGVSRALTHQLVRHRLASFTQQSQRYVPYDSNAHYVVPISVEASKEASREFGEAMEKISGTYRRLIDLGIPLEDARYVLPNAAKTNVLLTMNARELKHFFKVRCCERAQWEIRELATEMLRQVKEVAPTIFKDAGPECVELDYCPEGALTCGRIEEVQKKFRT
ncbi:MAG TPA: FAD-dependent thymidylate synthase [Candidatus Bathyarchaeia archaeon]|nr:FAD-dependent thymidylate synthase [Candidatus Bathyarchaeia archaeon]